MTHSLCGFLALLGCVAASGADQRAVASSDVARCFKVRRLLRSDATHYWADWRNSCPYTIEAVYVTVGFLDGKRKEMGNGVWPMYFVEPGAHRVTRFSAPVAGFVSVHVHGITTNFAEALSQERGSVKLVERSLPPGLVGDTGVGRVISDESGAVWRKGQD